MNIQLTPISQNVKTGPMPVSSSSKDTCPSICPLMNNGCYGETGPISFHWKKVSNGDRMIPWERFIWDVSALFPGTIWRHNQVGDLAHVNQEIDRKMAMELTEANRGRKGFSYSHHDVVDSEHNREVIKDMNDGGFTVNLSADSMADADIKAGLGIAPVVMILPKKPPYPKRTPDGRPILVCLNTTIGITCLNCKVCQVASRKSIIGFPAHGTRWRKAEEVFSTNNEAILPANGRGFLRTLEEIDTEIKNAVLGKDNE